MIFTPILFQMVICHELNGIGREHDKNTSAGIKRPASLKLAENNRWTVGQEVWSAQALILSSPEPVGFARYLRLR
jgi:hypothetical protein